MTRFRISTPLLLLAGLVVGIAVGSILRYGAGNEDVTADWIFPEGRRDSKTPVEKKERELRAALEWVKSEKGGTAYFVNLEEQVLRNYAEDLANTNGGSTYNIGICRKYTKLFEEAGGSTLKARILEIGPGINLGTGLVLAMMGAQKYYGLDVYRDPDLLAAPHYESVVSLMTRVAPGDVVTPAKDVMRIEGGQVVFDKDKVEYLYPRQSYDIPLADGTLDFVFSHSTLEHVADPMKTAESVARVLRSGGITAHHIDLRDHRDFSKPLEFLKLDKSAWENLHKDPAYAYLSTNRWRASDFKAAFEKYGMTVLTFEATSTCTVTEETRKSLHPDFQKHSLEDLSVLSVLIVAKKP